eukprot:gene464-306_t
MGAASAENNAAKTTGSGCYTPLPSDIRGMLRWLSFLTKARKQKRLATGGIALSGGETLEMKFNDEGWPVSMRAVVDGSGEGSDFSVHASHSIIEELMVLANHSVATKMLSTKQKTFGRVHADTGDKVRQSVLKYLKSSRRAAKNDPDALHYTPLPEGLSKLSLAQLMAWCEKNLDPASYQCVAFEAKTAFTAAEYRVVEAPEDEEAVLEAGAERQTAFEEESESSEASSSEAASSKVTSSDTAAVKVSTRRAGLRGPKEADDSE